MASRPAAPASGAILVVEDKDSLRAMLRLALEGQRLSVIEARDEPEALANLRTEPIAMVLTDLRLPAGSGLGVLRAARDLDPELPVIVMTAYGSIQDAVTAMKEGALDFLAKPVEPEHLLLLVDRALAHRRLLGDYRLLKEEAAARRGGSTILGHAPALRLALRALERAAGTETTVLLQGESGTGKELFARALHDGSARARGPFVAINCAAIPETLLEAELFGFERGAFTGATHRKVGRFELAERGTLFLDEIGEMSMPIQAKMLRAIETRQFERLGGTATIQADVRIVAATNRPLARAVEARRFREDLFFRLSVFPIAVPTLRDRRDDIPLLAHHCVERVCRDVGRPLMTLTPGAIEALVAHSWPGNVRELQNVIERAVILSDGDRLDARYLNLSVAPPPDPVDPWDQVDRSGSLAEATARAVREVERRKLSDTLTECGGDRGTAADRLQVGYAALVAKLREHGLG